MVTRLAAEERRALVLEVALEVGQRWAESCRDELRREGRCVEGGWPGTMSEARGKVDEQVHRALGARRWPVLTNDELTQATRTAYERARRVWLAMT